jgi:hypothetical protein
MADKIRGRVAAILNERELALNVGEQDGVREEMRFAILNSKGVNIVDPETHEPLGSVEVAKVLVKVTRVQEKLSVAQTFRTTKKNVGGQGSGLGIAISDMFQPADWIEVPETLRVIGRASKQELPDNESFVQVGDPVVEVTGDEFPVV